MSHPVRASRRPASRLHHAALSVRATSHAAQLACAVCGALFAGGLLLASSGVLAQTSDDKALPPVKVTAKRAQAEDLPEAFAGGQVGAGARLGMLGNVDVMDTPFNVTAYTAELIENRQARSLADVLMSDPSVRFTTSSGHPYENFRIRGFDVNQNDLAFNGMFGVMPLGHVPVEFFERVEVLKGPNAMFSGMAPSGAIGGVVNLVPKRAGDEPLTRASFNLLDSGQAQVGVDLGRRFGERQQWGLRVNAAYADGDTEIDGRSAKRELVSAALDYRDGGLRASLDMYSAKESFKGGTPAMYWFTTPNIPEAPKGDANQFPSAKGDLDSHAVIARVEYEFAPRLSAFAAVGFMKHDYSGFINGTHVRSMNAAGTSTSTITSAQRGYSDNVASEAGLRFGMDTGPVKHEFVLQASRLEQEAASVSNSSTAFTTNIYNPTYKAMPAMPTVLGKSSENTLSSVALVDTMSFLADKVRLTLGLRDQNVKTTNFTPATGAVNGTPYNKSAVTPAVAVVVKPWGPNVSLYANYVEGLSKGDSVAKTSGYVQDYTFAPYKTKQKEVGVKWNAGAFTNTVSLYEITKPMLLASGASPNMVATDDGEKRVSGLEWNTFGQIAPQVRLLGGAAYTDGVQTKTKGGTYDGKTAVGAPRWQGNLGAEWDTPWVQGLSLSSQVVATSSQWVDAANTIRIPGWAVLDAGARYQTQLWARKVAFRLNVANLLDKNYYSGAFSDTTPIATLGLGRTVSVSATMDF